MVNTCVQAPLRFPRSQQCCLVSRLLRYSDLFRACTLLCHRQYAAAGLIKNRCYVRHRYIQKLSYVLTQVFQLPCNWQATDLQPCHICQQRHQCIAEVCGTRQHTRFQQGTQIQAGHLVSCIAGHALPLATVIRGWTGGSICTCHSYQYKTAVSVVTSILLVVVRLAAAFVKVSCRHASPWQGSGKG